MIVSILGPGCTDFETLQISRNSTAGKERGGREETEEEEEEEEEEAEAEAEEEEEEEEEEPRFIR